MKGGWDEKDERVRETTTLPSSLYTQCCAERENSYTHAYIVCMCSNAKVISPVTCRSSVKYLMNPRPVETFFIDVIPGESALVPPSVFFFHDIPTAIAFCTPSKVPTFD